MKGWVYVISNKAMPGLYKIGYTMKDPEQRAKELNSTGVPHNFKVEYNILVDNPSSLEKRAHRLLSAYHERKEWFRCCLELCVSTIRCAYDGRIYFETNLDKIKKIDNMTIEIKKLNTDIDEISRYIKLKEQELDSCIKNIINRFEKKMCNIFWFSACFAFVEFMFVIFAEDYFEFIKDFTIIISILIFIQFFVCAISPRILEDGKKLILSSKEVTDLRNKFYIETSHLSDKVKALTKKRDELVELFSDMKR